MICVNCYRCCNKHTTWCTFPWLTKFLGETLSLWHMLPNHPPPSTCSQSCQWPGECLPPGTLARTAPCPISCLNRLMASQSLLLILFPIWTVGWHAHCTRPLSCIDKLMTTQSVAHLTLAQCATSSQQLFPQLPLTVHTTPATLMLSRLGWLM